MKRPERNGQLRFGHVLDIGWRWIGTISGFALFSVGSLVLGVTVLPIIHLFVRDRDGALRRSRAVVGHMMSCFAWYMRVAGIVQARIEGQAHIPGHEPCLVVANHPSLIDVIYLLAQFPTADCVVKGSLASSNPWMKFTLRLTGYIANTDPVTLIEESVARLEQGRSLILFPEGTRTLPGEPMQFRAGAAAIAVRSGRRCLPVLIDVRPPTLTKRHPWYHVPPSRIEFYMEVLPPIRPAEVVPADASIRVAGRAFHRYLQAFFEARLPPPGAHGQPIESAGRTVESETGT